MHNIQLDLKKILTYLVEGKIVPEEVLPKENSPNCSDEIVDLIERGSEFEYDPISDELYILKDDGSKLLCPDLSNGMSETVDWISNYLPDVFIDIDQGGNLRKGDEAESCYKLFCIAYVIKEYQKEIIDFFKKYNFETMSMRDGNDCISLKEVLQQYQNLNSIRINSIISSASYKMSLYKEKNESFYTGLLSPEETSELATLSRNIKAIISKYERNEGLNPLDMKSMNKMRKLELINKRDIEIEDAIERTNVSMIYKISKLTSERIPPVVKSRILKEADKGSKEYIEKFGLTGLDAIDVEQKVKRIIVKESYRAVLKTIKAKEIERYKTDKENFVFKRKS